MACECGCGEDAVNSSFKPGHDQKLRTLLEHRIGGLNNLRDLVESAEEFYRSHDTAILATKIASLFERKEKVPRHGDRYQKSS